MNTGVRKGLKKMVVGKYRYIHYTETGKEYLGRMFEEGHGIMWSVNGQFPGMCKVT